MKLTLQAIRSVALDELQDHARVGVAVTDSSTFDSLDMDSLDIVAFGYGVEQALSGFSADATSWTTRTTIGEAIEDIQKLYAKAHR